MYWANMFQPNPHLIALTASATWFKGKVEPGGPWDYKVRPGWGPYNKVWVAETYSGTRFMTTG